MDEIFSDIKPCKLMNNMTAPFFLEGKKEYGCVMMIHGFTGSPGDMLPLAKHLNDKGEGYTVCGILLPGHGTRMEEMNNIDWKEWVTYSSSKLKILEKEYKIVHLIGFSMGGNIALCLAGNHKSGRVVSICTPIIVKNKLFFLTGILSRFKKYTYWKKTKPLDGELVHDEPTGYSGMPVHAIGELRKLSFASFRRLKRVKNPLLIVQALKDNTVHRKSPYIIFDKVKSEYKELLILENSRHNAIRSPERHILYSACEEFLKKFFPQNRQVS